MVFFIQKTGFDLVKVQILLETPIDKTVVNIQVGAYATAWGSYLTASYVGSYLKPLFLKQIDEKRNDADIDKVDKQTPYQRQNKQRFVTETVF